MKLALVLCALSLTWIQSCVIIEKKSTNSDEFPRLWSSVIDELNQEVTNSHLLKDDLHALYADELSQIAILFQNIKATTNKNIFFHEHLMKANELSFDKLGFDMKSSKNSMHLAAKILAQIETHPIASSKYIRAYDADEQIGFCFGRALLAHYLLLKAGIKAQDIQKVFALGEFRLGGQFWRFHVAVMIESPEGYIVIDPLYGEPALLKDWCKNVSSLDVKQPLSRARFYFTDPRKFMPSTASYALELLSPPELKPYFLDLGRSLMRITKYKTYSTTRSAFAWAGSPP